MIFLRYDGYDALCTIDSALMQVWYFGTKQLPTLTVTISPEI